MADTIPHTAPCDPGLEGYRRYKCRCQECKDANSQYGRDRRARLKQEQGAPDNVRPLRSVATQPDESPKPSAPPAPEPPPEPTEPGDVEQAVIDECAGLTIGGVSVVTDRPAAVMQARKMARILDNVKMEKDHAQCSRQLTIILAGLHAGAKTKSKGRLVAIQKMTNRKPLGNSDDRAQG